MALIAAAAAPTAIASPAWSCRVAQDGCGRGAM